MDVCQNSTGSVDPLFHYLGGGNYNILEASNFIQR